MVSDIILSIYPFPPAPSAPGALRKARDAPLGLCAGMMHAVANVTAVRPTAGPRSRPRALSAKSAAPKSVQMGSSVRMSSRSGAARLGRRSTRTFATEGEYPNIAIALNGYAGRNGDVNDRSRPGRSTRRPSDSAPTRTLPADRP